MTKRHRWLRKRAAQRKAAAARRGPTPPSAKHWIHGTGKYKSHEGIGWMEYRRGVRG